jgi:hypothetical protein
LIASGAWFDVFYVLKVLDSYTLHWMPRLWTSLGEGLGKLPELFVYPVGDTDAVKAQLATLVGLWAIWLFGHGRRLKTAEILISLEEGSKEHVVTLLGIENRDTYQTKYLPGLKKSNVLARVALGDWTTREDEPRDLSREESVSITELEKALRHLHLCRHVRGTGTSSRAIDRAYSYYLRMLVDDGRQEMRDYLMYFWPGLYAWGHYVDRPWPLASWLRVGYYLRATWHRYQGKRQPIAINAQPQETGAAAVGRTFPRPVEPQTGESGVDLRIRIEIGGPARPSTTCSQSGLRYRVRRKLHRIATRNWRLHRGGDAIDASRLTHHPRTT